MILAEVMAAAVDELYGGKYHPADGAACRLPGSLGQPAAFGR